MKKLYFIALLLGYGLTAQAQQTIFNVPSSDITPRHKILAQEQVSLDEEKFQSTTTVNYGLGHNWEVGANLYNLNYLRQEHVWEHNDTTVQTAYAPLLLINAQKTFDLNDNLHIGVGTQTGINIAPTRRTTWVGLGYANLAGDFKDEHYKAVVGAYVGNQRYLAKGPIAGVHMGIDAGIWYQKVHILADWATGTHEYGQVIAGVEVYLQKHLPLAIGWRRSNDDGQQAVVVQLTYTPK